MRVAITGSSGMIGTALGKHLRSEGHDVVRVVRDDQQAGTSRAGDEIAWSPASGRIDADAFDGLDGVVHLAGVGIGDKRWSEEYKRLIRSSRIEGTTLVASTIAKSSRPPRVLVSASGINVYGDRGDEVLDERSSVAGDGDSFLAQLCLDWERAAQCASAAGTRVVSICPGMVLSPRGGALRKQLPLFRFGLGGRLGSGRQWQSWITLSDEVAAISHLLHSELAGPVNLTAPHPVTNAQLTKALASAVHRPAIIPIPKFGPSLVLGRELAGELLFTSMRVVPTALLDDGFSFRHPTLSAALTDLL